MGVTLTSGVKTATRVTHGYQCLEGVPVVCRHHCLNYGRGPRIVQKVFGSRSGLEWWCREASEHWETYVVPGGVWRSGFELKPGGCRNERLILELNNNVVEWTVGVQVLELLEID